MTAGAVQPRARNERRIIERPRLIKLLDDTDARTILLLAPAGYGKTTLARQWAKTLSGAVWVTLTAAHTDVAWLAEDVAQAVDAKDGAGTRVIREHIRARSNPQRAARALGSALAEQLDASDVRWLVLDDYQEIAPSSAAEDLIATLERQSGARMLVATRVRPGWASGRRFVYGEVFEINRGELAMTDDEAATVLGRRPPLPKVSALAQGWPAVIGLAAAADSAVIPPEAVPQVLHRYLAEELFHTASDSLQEGLLRLALLSPRSEAGIQAAFGEDAESMEIEAERLGFNASDTTFELHPLLREFLLEKLVVRTDGERRVRDAIATHTENDAWDHVLALIDRFGLEDLVEPTLADAFRPLVRSGRLATLVAFIEQIGEPGSAPSAQVIRAEAAFRDGAFDLALDVAETLRAQLAQQHHPLSSRAAALVGQVSFLQADFTRAELAFRDARDSAVDERDLAEATYGLASASIFGEQLGAPEAVDALRISRDRSPVDFLRFICSEISLRLLGQTANGLRGNLHLQAAREMLPRSEDPRVRTSATYTLASALTLRGEYERARTWLSEFFADAEEFGLEFAMPYANWTLAQIATGQRRFGEAERALQAIEDAAARTGERHHELNAKALRARLLLQSGKPDEAARCVSAEPDIPLIPSWHGEYVATRSLALACIGDSTASEDAAAQAQGKSAALQVQGLVHAARAVNALDGSSVPPPEVLTLLRTALALDVWDPVVCTLRCAPALGDLLANQDELRPTLERLYQRVGEVALARRAGFRTRSTSTPTDVLSPREYEVLGLIARGYKNREISRALFIAESTTKVHVMHILEKLGVRTRAEAVARLQMFDSA